MSSNFVNPADLCPTFGWTHVATVTGGTTVYVSGQVSVDDRGAVVGAGDLRQQTRQAFQNVARALAAVGASFVDVVKTNLYVVGLKPEHVSIIREIRSQFVSSENPPVSTLVGVSALVGAEWLIEIEAVAVVPEAGKA
jgi:enamine deaminase RidA (YjgF/YER057c/UK114 family)